MEAKRATRGKKLHYGWLVMAACGLIQLGDIGIFSNCGGVFIQPVCDELGFARADFQLYMSIITLTMALTMPLAQRILTRVNLRTLVSACVALECLAFGMMSQYDSVYGWYISGLVLGLGHAYLTYLLLPYLLNNWFKVRYGLALGLACCCSTLGGAIFCPSPAGSSAASAGATPTSSWRCAPSSSPSRRRPSSCGGSRRRRA